MELKIIIITCPLILYFIMAGFTVPQDDDDDDASSLVENERPDMLALLVEAMSNENDASEAESHSDDSSSQSSELEHSISMGDMSSSGV